MTEYDADFFDPPAPVAYVNLRRPSHSNTISAVPMLIDTGADVTLVPREAITALGVSPESNLRYRLVGFDGSAQKSSVVRLELIFSSRKFTGQFLVIEQESGILGRNILNQLPLFLDGPNQVWDVKKL